MENNKTQSSVIASLFAGIGFGLLLGLVMGLSVSPTVKVVIGALAAVLGGALGLENKLGKSDANEKSSLERNVKLGSFGFAVVAGILFGITIRTHNLLAPSISQKVKTWVDAGYDEATARKYVAYELLSIQPSNGEIDTIQNSLRNRNMGALFNSHQENSISLNLDTTYFSGDIAKAKFKLKKLELPALDELLDAVADGLPIKNHMQFLTILQKMAYQVEEGKAAYSQLPADIMRWRGKWPVSLANLLIGLDAPKQKLLSAKVRAFFYELETNM